MIESFGTEEKHGDLGMEILETSECADAGITLCKVA